MKPAPAFTFGLATGLGLFAAFNFWQTATQLSAIPVPPPPPAHTQSTSTSSAGSASAQPTSTPDTPQDTLESALREIREAGMVIIPQEFLRFYTPVLFSRTIDKNFREVLRLDEREITMMTSARLQFEQRLTAESAKNLVITENGKDFIAAKIPALPELRRDLIASTRNDIIGALDSESAELFSLLDWEKALSNLPEGRESTLRVRRVEGDDKLHVTVVLGTMTKVISMSREETIRAYPSLRDHLDTLLKP